MVSTSLELERSPCGKCGGQLFRPADPDDSATCFQCGKRYYEQPGRREPVVGNGFVSSHVWVPYAGEFEDQKKKRLKVRARAFPGQTKGGPQIGAIMVQCVFCPDDTPEFKGRISITGNRRDDIRCPDGHTYTVYENYEGRLVWR